jgi:hypothetical protein
LFNPGDVVAIDFPGVTGVKRRPTVNEPAEQPRGKFIDVIHKSVAVVTRGLSAR